MNDENKLKSLLGIAKKAGKAILGTDMTVEAIRGSKKKSVKLILVAKDASQTTVKRINNTGSFYKIPVIVAAFDKGELAHIVGSQAELSVVGISDEGFAKAMIKTRENENGEF